jgi:YVTN family beta-propeller protein
VSKVIATDADANLTQAIILNPATKRAYVPQTRSFSANPALLFDTTVFPTISAIDLGSAAHVPRERISIDIADQPVNMPLDAVFTNGKLYVANAGSDDVSVIDLAARRAVAHLSAGNNPRGMAISPDERTVYVNNVLSGTITVIDTATDSVRATIESTSIPLASDILNGKILFHTSNRTTLSKDRWISCATCHFEGGADGRTWFFRDGPRNSTALFGLSQTMPMHWSGDLDEIQDVESTIRIVQAGTGLAPGESHCEPACDAGPPNAGRAKDLDDLAAFIASLTPPPHPGGIDREAAARGSLLFNDSRLGCGVCHPAPLFTDRLKHDVGTGTNAKERKGRSFDTPSLRGLYDTAPYLHDGSAATLLDDVRASTGQHGNTTGLTDGEKDDLVEFLRSIPFLEPKRRSAAR